MGENRGNDSAVIKFISSANIACGGHAGDEDTMKRTVSLAVSNNVMTGAHPGYPDRDNFGRNETGMDNEAISHEVVTQINRLKKIVDSEGSAISHIKLHGALYNKAASDYDLMYHISEIILLEFGPIPIFTLAGSVSEKAISASGGVFFSEGFADRAYDDYGKLVSRKLDGAILHDENFIAKRVLNIIKARKVTSLLGHIVNLSVDTICVHGDTPGAVQMAATINEELLKNNILIRRNDEV